MKPPSSHHRRHRRRQCRRGRAAVRAFGLLSLAAGLAACSAFGEQTPQGPCPQAVVVQDAARQIKFQSAGRDLTDVLFETRLQRAQLICEYDEEAIEATLRVRFFTARGPADQQRQARIDYFVAIARQADLRVIAREEFSLAVPFEGNRTQVAVTEELEPRIPIQSGQTGADYKIFVGLALSPAELEYNRANR